MKLSPNQQRILDLMANGWELGLETTIYGQYSIQKGGIGKGGESFPVNGNTAQALFERRQMDILRHNER